MRVGIVGVLLSSVYALGAFMLSGCDGSRPTHSHHESSEAEELSRGPHGGREFKDNDLSVELVMFEQGVPPRYRLYLTSNGEAIAGDSYQAQLILKRLGNEEESIQFTPVGDFQESAVSIEEPHSFDLSLNLKYKDVAHDWNFSSYEGRVVIAPDVAARSGIVSEVAGPRLIRESLLIRGKIFPSEHRIAHVIPRFPGIVKEGRKHIGDMVTKGEVLAVIESNQSLQPFEVRSQIAGTIINGHLIVGEFVPENQWVFIVADLSEVWGDFFVPVSQRDSVRQGQRVEVLTGLGDERVSGVVSYVAPYADERSQAQIARVVLPNPDRRFIPGMFVNGNLITAETEARVVVKDAGIQSFRNSRVVFLVHGDTYEVRPVVLGHRDGEWVEVISGLKSGERYVSEGSYIVKADILKSGAAHDH